MDFKNLEDYVEKVDFDFQEIDYEQEYQPSFLDLNQVFTGPFEGMNVQNQISYKVYRENLKLPQP